MTALMLLVLVLFQTVAFCLVSILSALAIYWTYKFQEQNPEMLLKIYACLALIFIAFGTLVSAGNGLDI